MAVKKNSCPNEATAVLSRYRQSSLAVLDALVRLILRQAVWWRGLTTFSPDDFANRSTSNLALCLHCNCVLRPFTATFIRDEGVIVPGNGEPKDDHHHSQVRQDEACDVHGIVTQSVELWVCKTEDDGENWAGDVSK